MSYVAAAIVNALSEGPTDSSLVAGWLYQQGSAEEVVTALPSALLDAEPRVIQNAQEGINRLWSMFNLLIVVDLQAEVNRLKHNTESRHDQDAPAKRARRA